MKITEKNIATYFICKKKIRFYLKNKNTHKKVSQKLCYLKCVLGRSREQGGKTQVCSEQVGTSSSDSS